MRTWAWKHKIPLIQTAEHRRPLPCSRRLCPGRSNSSASTCPWLGLEVQSGSWCWHVSLTAERRSCINMYFWPSCSSAGHPSALRADEKKRKRLGSKDGLGSPLLPGRSRLPGKWGWQMPQSRAPSSPPNIICSLCQCPGAAGSTDPPWAPTMCQTPAIQNTVSVLLGLPGQQAAQQDPSGDSRASLYTEMMLFPAPRPWSRKREVGLGADNSFQN